MESDDRLKASGTGEGPARAGKAGGSGRRAALAAGIVAALMLVALLAIYIPRGGDNPASAPSKPGPLQEYNTSYMSVPARGIGTAAAFYEYNTSGTTIRFFVVRDGSGTVRTAFDECPNCYGKHLGFRQEGDKMVENCCNMSFPIASIGPGVPGCRPEYLPSTVEGGRVLIAKRDLMAGTYLFAKGGPPSGVEEYNMTSISIPLSSIGVNATWYRYNISGAEVRLFAVKDAGGTVHTAFDECPMCYGNHLGYRQEGDMMVENCCDMPFPVANITAAGCNISGCHPAYLASKVDGDRLVVAKSALAAGAKLFLTDNEFAGVRDLNGTAVALNLSSLGGRAQWFEYRINGTVVRLFAVKDGNGTVHASLDICQKCYKKHAGFRQEGGSMVENCCNMAYPVENITAERCAGTGCHPEFLPSHVEGDLVVLAKSDLEAGSYMFKSGGR